MYRPSYYASSSSSPSSPSSPPSPNISRPNKVILQRQYRSKEGECFNTLRDIIHKSTGEVLQTRHEILTKVIELLLADPRAGKSKDTGVTYPGTPYEVSSPIDFNDMTLDHTDYSSPSSSWSQTWHPAVEPDAQTAGYYPQFSGQQYHAGSGTQPTLNFGGYGPEGGPAFFH